MTASNHERDRAASNHERDRSIVLRSRARAPARTRRAIALGACVALLHSIGFPAAVTAQARFHVIAHERIDHVGGLRIVEILDTLNGTCMTLFVTDGFARIRDDDTAGPETANQAAADRDRRLAELSVDFTAAASHLQTPGTLAPDPLPYHWEAQKVQTEYALRAFFQELTRLEWSMQSTAALPTPCPAARGGRSPARDESGKR
jgi:hypothetical protein